MALHVLCVGGEDHSLRIPFLNALKDRGFAVTAASTTDGAAFAKAGLDHRVYHFDRFHSRGGDLATIRQLARHIAEVQPDIVQSFDTKPNILTPFAARNCAPVVRTINGMGWVFSSASISARTLRPIYCALQRFASRWVSATVFQNRDDKLYFEQRKLNGRSRSCLIRSSGIDVAAFERARACGPSALALREQLNLGDAQIVVTISRLTKQKGIPTLLKAASIVREVRPNVRFLLVGPRESEGPFAVDQAEIDRLAPHVIALGARTDVPALLGLATLFVLPTEYREGIPRVLLEAGLAGLPIVTTSMPGCSDVVTDSWNGYLTPPHDPRALATRILELLDNPENAKSMGARSIALVQREFHLDNVVTQYSDLYKQISSSRSASGPTSSAHVGVNSLRQRRGEPE